MSNSFVTPWTVAHQAPPSIGFPRQEYWSGSPFLFPGKLPDPGIEPIFPALARRFFTAEPLGKLNFFDSPFLFSVIVVHSLHCYKYSIWWKKYFYTCGWVFGLFPAFYWWVFGWLPDFCYYEQCFHEHNCMGLLVYMCRNSSRVSVIPLMGISGLHSVFVHKFVRYARDLLASHPSHFLWLYKKTTLLASPAERMGLYSQDLATIMRWKWFNCWGVGTPSLRKMCCVFSGVFHAVIFLGSLSRHGKMSWWGRHVPGYSE